MTYRLTLPPSMKIHPVFHVDLLTHYRETEAHGPNYERPPPDIINGELEWEVVTILLILSNIDDLFSHSTPVLYDMSNLGSET